MTRGIGGAEFAAALPDAVVALAGLVTQLGDMWFVVLGVLAVYGIARQRRRFTPDPPRDALYLFALAIGSYAFTLLLKHTFALPRPPGAATATLPLWLPPMTGPAYESMVTGDGYGFPSGHALKSTVVYGAAALTLEGWTRYRRVVAASGIIVAVALSRVLLGVHYVVDVAVGVLLGAAFLGVVTRTANRDPSRTLALSAVLGLLAFGISFSVKAALVCTVALAGLGIWTYRERGAVNASLRE